MGVESLPRSIELIGAPYEGLVARIVDQRELPAHLRYLEVREHGDMIAAIKTLAVRGAPAIGVAGAAAVALFAVNEYEDTGSAAELLSALERIAPEVGEARPTAVNLSWAVGRMLEVAREQVRADDDADALRSRLVDEVRDLERRDEAANRAIGTRGAALLEPASRILTHCNAGSLATVFFGTALGIVYAAHAEGKIERVYADETRPVGQGARLTTWELARAGVPCTLIGDSMAASVMAADKIDAVIVGADRIARNGDTANKIGTYGLAVLARHHGIPFYVAAPWSTIDRDMPDGSVIPIEERESSEVAPFLPDGVEVYNPAFDVTPAEFISAIITDRGVYSPEQIKEDEQTG